MSRPRDRLGRPLPAGSVPPGDVPPVPDLVGESDAVVWDTAMRLLADGLPFHAHEVFEDRWRIARREGSPHADAWRAVAQWGAALTQAARGNASGARRLAERTLASLDAAAQVPEVIDTGRVRESCAALASPG